MPVILQAAGHRPVKKILKQGGAKNLDNSIDIKFKGAAFLKTEGTFENQVMLEKREHACYAFFDRNP